MDWGYKKVPSFPTVPRHGLIHSPLCSSTVSEIVLFRRYLSPEAHLMEKHCNNVTLKESTRFPGSVKMDIELNINCSHPAMLSGFPALTYMDLENSRSLMAPELSSRAGSLCSPGRWGQRMEMGPSLGSSWELPFSLITGWSPSSLPSTSTPDEIVAPETFMSSFFFKKNINYLSQSKKQCVSFSLSHSPSFFILTHATRKPAKDIWLWSMISISKEILRKWIHYLTLNISIMQEKSMFSLLKNKYTRCCLFGGILVASVEVCCKF